MTLPRRVTYVYYEQYLTVVAEGLLTLVLCLVPTFGVSFLLLGMDLRSSGATVLTITMALLDTVGAMALWGVPYNAVTLINLVAVRGGGHVGWHQDPGWYVDMGHLRWHQDRGWHGDMGHLRWHRDLEWHGDMGQVRWHEDMGYMGWHRDMGWHWGTQGGAGTWGGTKIRGTQGGTRTWGAWGGTRSWGSVETWGTRDMDLGVAQCHGVAQEHEAHGVAP